MSARTTSTALAAILALSAMPALAQTETEGTAPGADSTAAQPAAQAGESAADVAQQAADAAAQAADSAAGAANEAVDAANDAVDSVNAGTDASDDQTPDDADATEDAATEDAATGDDTAESAPAADAETGTDSEMSDTGGEAEAPAGTAQDQQNANAPASSEPQLGTYYERETHADWTMRCIRTESGADPCELYQLMRDGQGNSVAEITLIPLQNGGEAVAGATVIAPLETDLASGIGLRVDSGERQAYPFNFCAPVGCVSRIGLTNEALNGMRRGNQATVSLLPYGAPADQVVNLPLSLSGFTAGYQALEGAIAEMRESAPAEAAPAQ